MQIMPFSSERSASPQANLNGMSLVESTDNICAQSFQSTAPISARLALNRLGSINAIRLILVFAGIYFRFEI